jgi:CDGSH-type Zn-finger protein
MTEQDRRPAASVTTYPDGPLIVRGDFELRDIDGEPLDAARTVALCRCGRSAVKPFCDGSHKTARRSGRKAGPAAGRPAQGSRTPPPG